MSSDLLLVLVVVAVALFVAKRLFIGGKVSSKTVLEKLKAGAKVVDVRSREEFRDGAYPGAINIPLQDLARRLGELPKDKPVILYCASGARSAAAARAMKQAGFTDVLNAGGLSDMPR